MEEEPVVPFYSSSPPPCNSFSPEEGTTPTDETSNFTSKICNNLKTNRCDKSEYEFTSAPNGSENVNGAENHYYSQNANEETPSLPHIECNLEKSGDNIQQNLSDDLSSNTDNLTPKIKTHVDGLYSTSLTVVPPTVNLALLSEHLDKVASGKSSQSFEEALKSGSLLPKLDAVDADVNICDSDNENVEKCSNPVSEDEEDNFTTPKCVLNSIEDCKRSNLDPNHLPISRCSITSDVENNHSDTSADFLKTKPVAHMDDANDFTDFSNSKPDEFIPDVHNDDDFGEFSNFKVTEELKTNAQVDDKDLVGFSNCEPENTITELHRENFGDFSTFDKPSDEAALSVHSDDNNSGQEDSNVPNIIDSKKTAESSDIDKSDDDFIAGHMAPSFSKAHDGKTDEYVAGSHQIDECEKNDEDFGDFSSTVQQATESCNIDECEKEDNNDFSDFSCEKNNEDDDFGDFSSKTQEVTALRKKDECGKEDDDFGDFSSKALEATKQHKNDDDDDFGDFSSRSQKASFPTTFSAKEDNFGWTSDANDNDDDEDFKSFTGATFSSKATNKGGDDFGDFEESDVPKLEFKKAAFSPDDDSENEQHGDGKFVPTAVATTDSTEDDDFDDFAGGSGCWKNATSASSHQSGPVQTLSQPDPPKEGLLAQLLLKLEPVLERTFSEAEFEIERENPAPSSSTHRLSGRNSSVLSSRRGDKQQKTEVSTEPEGSPDRDSPSFSSGKGDDAGEEMDEESWEDDGTPVTADQYLTQVLSVTDKKNPIFNSVWKELIDWDNSLVFKYNWSDSHGYDAFLKSLGIDYRNVLKPGLPMFASQLGLLEPLKPGDPTPAATSSNPTSGILQPQTVAPSSSNITGPSSAAGESTSISSGGLSVGGSSSIGGPGVPPPEFDWGSSGLTNPLDSSNCTVYLDLDFLEFHPSASQYNPTSGNVCPNKELEDEFLGTDPPSTDTRGTGSSNQAPFSSGGTSSESSAIQRILQQHQSSTLPDESTLSEEARHLVKRLPDLAFMGSSVLMFPVRTTDYD